MSGSQKRKGTAIWKKQNKLSHSFLRVSIKVLIQNKSKKCDKDDQDDDDDYQDDDDDYQDDDDDDYQEDNDDDDYQEDDDDDDDKSETGRDLRPPDAAKISRKAANDEDFKK